jgi:periplasmic protein TonB
VRLANSQALSLGLHAAALGIILFLTARSIQSPPRARPVVSVIAPLRLHVPRTAAPEHSGGSSRTLLPARRGAPPPTAHRTFIPPRSIPDPKLPMPMTVVFDSPTIQIDPSAIGDPSSRLLAGGFGDQGGTTIGNRPGGPGIGPGGSGPPGISSTTRGRAITPPVLIFQVDPEFSEEARKAKYQGTVLLAIEIDTSGHPANIRVLEGLGMGLDEKAIEAVSRWRFRPGLQNAKPAVTSATVQVTFRLL